MNQVECHPYFNQEKLISFCKSYGIVVTAYSPLGSPGRPVHQAKSSDKGVLEESKIREIARRHRKTPAQVVLRYQVRLTFFLKCDFDHGSSSFSLTAEWLSFRSRLNFIESRKTQSCLISSWQANKSRTSIIWIKGQRVRKYYAAHLSITTVHTIL